MQLKVSLAAPALVASGSISMDFDPAVFGSIARVAAFSATGDQIGFANAQGLHLDAQFSSPSAGIGQLPGLPVFAVWLPVLPGAAPGAVASITVDPTGSAWKDPLGNQYSVTVNPGKVTVGGTLSVASVTPGGGLIPAATVIQITGTGFNSTTTVSIDGVSVSAVQFVSSQEIDVTLGAPTEMTGKHVRVANATGAAVDYYAALPSAADNPPSKFASIHAIMASATYGAVTVSNSSSDRPGTHAIALLNQNLTPVNVLLQLENVLVGPSFQETISIPAGALYWIDIDAAPASPPPYVNQWWVTPSAPIRMVQYSRFVAYTVIESVSPPPPAISGPPPLQVQPPAPIFFRWQIGTALPDAISTVVYAHPQSTVAFQVSFSTSVGHWLNVTPTQGTTPATLTATVNPTGLRPGTYQGTITMTPVLPASLNTFSVQSTTISVTLEVDAIPILIVSPATYIVATEGGPVASSTLTVGSSGTTAAFTAAVSTSSGGNWLSMTPLKGITPATVTLTANPAGLSAGRYSGTVTFQCLGNPTKLDVSLYVQLPGGAPLSVALSSLSFVLQSGEEPIVPNTQLLSFYPLPLTLTSVGTESAGNWLAASIESKGPNPAVRVNASATGLAPGTYKGTVTVTSEKNGSVQVPVTLTVFAAPTPQTPVTVTPSSFSFTAQAGQQSAPQLLRVDSGGVPILFKLSVTTADGGLWLYVDKIQSAVTDIGRYATPATFSLLTTNASRPAAIYHGNLAVTWSTGSVNVPVTLNVTASPSSPPAMAAIVSAGSLKPGVISPGEIITIFGSGIGPPATGLALDASGKVATTLSGTQVLINGVPAPLTYASVAQLNAIVPYEVGTAGTATIKVVTNGLESAAWGVPLAPSAPSIFTLGAAGAGQAAVLNQDNSVNGTASPAAPGTTIQIYATGEGLTSPPGVTGSVIHSDLKTPVLPYSVTIGGVDATVLYAGSAGESVAGLFQVNAVIPPGVMPGPAVPVSLKVGNATSPPGVTIAVQ